MTSVSHADYDRLLLGSPLRRRPVCIVICVALLAALSLATLIHLGLLASMRLGCRRILSGTRAFKRSRRSAARRAVVSRPARA